MEKKLTTDEYAEAMNSRAAKIKELEDANYETGEDHLLFKWGTLKGWKLTSTRGKELLGKYFELGSSLSAIAQHDTDEQKQLICEMIDECNGSISSDWTGEYFTKAAAKEYILTYGNKDQSI